MFRKKEVLMNKVDESGNAGGGAGLPESMKTESNTNADQGGQASGENSQGSAEGETGNVDSSNLKAEVEALRKEKESLLSKRDEILNEKKTLQQKLKEIEASKTKEALEKAEANGDIEAKLAILERELEKERTRAEEFESKEAQRREKLLMDAKKAQFLKELGADVRHPKHLQDVDWSKVIQNEDGTWNKEGLTQAVEDFRTEFGHCIKENTKESLDQSAPKGTSTRKEETFADRLKKGGSAII